MQSLICNNIFAVVFHGLVSPYNVCRLANQATWNHAIDVVTHYVMSMTSLQCQQLHKLENTMFSYAARSPKVSHVLYLKGCSPREHHVAPFIHDTAGYNQQNMNGLKVHRGSSHMPRCSAVPPYRNAQCCTVFVETIGVCTHSSMECQVFLQAKLQRI